MKNYLHMYHDVIDDEKCDELIDKFESDKENHEVQNNGAGATLTQISLLHSPDTIWKDDAMFVINAIMGKVEEYKKDFNIQPYQWPEKFGIEPPKIKRYMPDTDDEFPNHVDVLDYETARRFLVGFLYLDDNSKGQTVFDNQDGASFDCKRGSLVLFPPMWPWIHRGEKPILKPKYLIGTYLHYA